MRQRQEEVTGRLHALASYLDGFRGAVERAGSVLSGTSTAAALPVRPASVNVAEIKAHAAELAQAERSISASLERETTTAADQAEAQLKKLHDTATRLSAGPGEQFPSEQLLTLRRASRTPRAHPRALEQQMYVRLPGEPHPAEHLEAVPGVPHGGLVGVVTNGLFAARPADVLLLATAEGVKTFTR